MILAIQTISLWGCFFFFSRVTRSSNDQKWKKWTLPAGCAKPWASTSPVLQPAALSEQTPHAPSYNCPDTPLGLACIHINILHIHVHKPSHIGTFFILLLGKKQQQTKQKHFGLPVHFFFHQQQGPLSHCTVRPQLHHASVKSSHSSLFHTATEDVNH